MNKGLHLLFFLILPLSVLPASDLFMLDIYVNDILWENYPEEELLSIMLPGENERGGMEPLIPIRELLPLMESWHSMNIRIPGGEILLDGDELKERLDSTALKQTGTGRWQIVSGQDIYSHPLRISLYGKTDPVKELTLWSEPGLNQYRELLQYWGTRHKVLLNIQERDNIRDEIIHRKMTGDYLPDFTLTRLHPADEFNMENTISYQLRSVIIREGPSPGRLIVPLGKEAHEELFFSLMASCYGYVYSEEILNSTARIYNSLLSDRLIQEKTEANLKNGNRALFFPAEDHREQRGISGPLPPLEGMENGSAGRVLPIVLNSPVSSRRMDSLRSYLKHPGIQFSLLDIERRHLPAADIPGEQTPAYYSLLEERKKGFILNNENYTLWKQLQRGLPILLINNMEVEK